MTRHTLTLFAAALLLAAPTTHAQDRPVDTSFLKRYAETRGFMLGRPQKPKFTPDGKTVLFLRADPPAPRLKLFAFDVESKTTKLLLSPEMLLKGGEENLTPEEKARRERQRVSTGGFADYHLDDKGQRVLVMLSGRPYVFDIATAKARELNAGKGTIVDPKWSPDGKFVSYVRDHDVYAYDLAADKEQAVTTGGTQVKTHGLAEFVAQEEMDRFTGYWWSPDSKFIAYEEADHEGVEVWHIADPFKPGGAPQPQYYPRPGKKNVSVRLGVVPVSGGETKWIEWDRKRFEYLGRVVWGKSVIALVLQSRDQKSLSFQRADPKTGRISICFELSPNLGRIGFTISTGDVQWQELPPAPRPLLNTDTFLCLTPAVIGISYGNSERGMHDLFEIDMSAEQTAVSIGGVRNGELIAIDPHTKHMYFQAETISPQRHIFRYRDQLTTEPGIHSVEFSKDTKFGVFTATTLDKMPQSVVRSTDPAGGQFGMLPSAAADPPFIPNVKIDKVGDFTPYVEPAAVVGAAADVARIEKLSGYWTAIVRPRNFDPKKKYPVIVDVYGGPHHLHVVQAMRNWLVPQWLADQGFIVVAVENRGTPGRGRDWERAIYQKFGTVPLEDQVAGLKLLCEKYPELDRERVGIVGWSFGGYMAANAVLRRPDVFKAAVAGAPVTDWEDYDTHYTERYLGLLPESKKAYEEASLLPLAKDLKRPLLLVHGTADDNVYYRHSLKLADALFRAGREFESLPLPGITHMYSADPQVTERLWERSVTFFKRHLGEAK